MKNIQRYGILLCLWLTTLTVILPAQSYHPDSVQAAARALQAEQLRAVRVAVRDTAPHLAHLIRLGQWEYADFLIGASAAPHPPSFLLAQVSLLHARNQFAEAEALLAQVLAADPTHREALIWRARLYIEAWELAAAETLGVNLLRQGSPDPAAAVVVGQVRLLQKDYGQALTLAHQAIAWDSTYAPAWLLKAEVHFWQLETAAAAAALRTCLRLDPWNPDARFAYGYAIWRTVDATRLDEMAAHWELALQVHPLHYRTHWHWGNGHTHLTYADYADPDERVIRQFMQAADSLTAAGAIRAALDMAHQAAVRWPASVLPVMQAGSIAYMAGCRDPDAGWLDTASAMFQAVLARKPHYGPAHNGLAAVIKQQRFPYLAAWDKLEQAIADTRISDPAGLTAIFPDLQRYPGDRMTRMVWGQLYASVAYFPHLRKLNQTFALPPLHIDLALAMRTPWFRGGTTFDNRQWMDIRGVGSGATGVEYVERGSHLERDVLLHEYVHLFHGTLFTDQEMRRVRALYYHAMANGLTLDYYAANNEFEYLAQAYPAYFSLTKIHPLNHKALATREDLIRKDPQLFGFIDSLVQRQQASLAGNATTLTSAWVMTYMTLSARARAQQNVSRALAYLDTAQVWDRNYIPVYQAYAAIYTELGEWDRAREWLDRASALGPGYAPLHQQRAEWTAARLQAGLLQEAEAVAQMAASYRQAINLETDFEMLASYNRALREMYAQAGYIREAIEVAEQYVAHAPLVSTYLRDERDEALAFAWGLKGRQGYGAGADTFFTDLIQRKPQAFRYRTLYAQVLLDQGRASAAVAVLEPAYTLLTATGNQDATLISLLVQAYAGAGEMSRAQALAGELQQRYIRKTPEYLYAMLAVGQTAAVADGLKAIGEPIYGWDRAVYFHLRASLLEMTGQRAAAAEPLQAALTACAYYTPARLALIARSRRSEARKLRAAGQRLDFPPGPWLQQALRDNQ